MRNASSYASSIKRGSWPAQSVLRRRKEFHLNTLTSTLNRISYFRQDQQILEQIHELMDKLGVDSGDFLAQTELPRITNRGIQSQRARAESCTNIRLSDQYEFLGRTRSQGNMGWCFAHAAADMMTFYYHKNNPGLSSIFGSWNIHRLLLRSNL